MYVFHNTDAPVISVFSLPDYHLAKDKSSDELNDLFKAFSKILWSLYRNEWWHYLVSFLKKKEAVSYIPLDSFPTNKVQVDTILNSIPSMNEFLKVGRINITTIGWFNVIIDTFLFDIQVIYVRELIVRCCFPLNIFIYFCVIRKSNRKLF